MAHIKLPADAPGVIGPMRAYPEPAKYLDAFTETLLRGPSSLSIAERELIATHVSHGNECSFCTQAHAATARHLLGENHAIVDTVLRDASSDSIDVKMRTLLRIADKVRRDGRLVTADDVDDARRAGADDQAIHDTVLIAATFCLYNRYVDGLATWTPTDPTVYRNLGDKLATHGYMPLT